MNDSEAAGADEPGSRDASRVLADLFAVWQQRTGEVLEGGPSRYARLAQEFISHGANVVAFDVALEGLQHHPGDVRLLQLQAHALNRSGAPQAARDILADLRRRGHEDSETLGLLASSHKSLALLAAEGAVRREHMQRAFESYRTAYARPDADYWLGINAASLGVVTGQHEEAQSLATAVRSQCLAVEEKSDASEEGDAPDRYWLYATLGEAALILARFEEAARWYERARGEARGRHGHVAASYRNAILVLDHLPACGPSEREAVLQALAPPAVVVFVGHMVDQPGRSVPRFPAALEGVVREALRGELQQIGACIVYASAACGSDILLLELAQAAGYETHVVLPFGQEEFARESVEIGPGGDWGMRYRRVLERATEVTTVSSQPIPWGGASHEYANRVLFGLARLHAQSLSGRLVPLAFWDGDEGDGAGGTAWNVRMWRRAGLEVRVVPPPPVADGEGLSPATQRPPTQHPATQHPATQRPATQRPGTASPPEPSEPTASGAAQEMRICALLFADAKGYSKLQEHQIPVFVRDVLGSVAQILRGSDPPPLARNTWGDALYVVFADVGGAGVFSLALARALSKLDRASLDLPEAMDFRIALHAGPVHRYVDPVTEQSMYGGTHANQAARIEPITPPGEVYASRWFAALAAAEGVDGFSCEYVGVVPLAKAYGSYPLYHVRPMRGGGSEEALS